MTADASAGSSKRKKARMPILELCAGYGGLGLAVEQLTGDEVAYVAETNPAACKVLAARFPDAPNIGDIRAYDWSWLVGQVDVITAGFPCQDISNAGPRKGITGERSGVWKSVAEAVRVIRPRILFLENVAAIRSRGLGVVAEDLAQVGYDLQWTCVRASSLGAAHHRDRWFGVAMPADTDRPRLAVGRVEPSWGQLALVERSGARTEDPDRESRSERLRPAPGQASRGGTWTNARR
jgi:DNA (cytosine-5)-methyltransferase 1